MRIRPVAGGEALPGGAPPTSKYTLGIGGSMPTRSGSPPRPCRSVATARRRPRPSRPGSPHAPAAPAPRRWWWSGAPSSCTRTIGSRSPATPAARAVFNATRSMLQQLRAGGLGVGAHGDVQARFVRDHVRRGAAAERADGDQRRLDRRDLAGHDGLQGQHDLAADHHRVVAEVRRGAVGGLAAHGDGHGVGAGIHQAVAEGDLARRVLGMTCSQRRVGAAEAPVQAIGDHALALPPLSSAGWPTSIRVPRQSRTSSPPAGRATPTRLVMCMSWPQACITGISSPSRFTCDGGGVRRAALLDHRQRVHVGAHQQGRPAPLRRIATTLSCPRRWSPKPRSRHSRASRWLVSTCSDSSGLAWKWRNSASRWVIRTTACFLAGHGAGERRQPRQHHNHSRTPACDFVPPSLHRVDAAPRLANARQPRRYVNKRRSARYRPTSAADFGMRRHIGGCPSAPRSRRWFR